LNIISQNNLIVTNNNVTKKFQKDVRNTINECQEIAHNNNKWKYIHLNPTTPVIKVHIVDKPIRPIVNWRNVPACKLAKMFSEKMKTYIHLPYVFNVRNTTTLIEDFTNIPFDQNLKIASFDTDNMNSNVPIDELLNIINIICDKYIMEDKLKQEVIKVSKLLTDQNYFIFQNGVHLQKEGFTMGAPTSSNFSEIY